MSCHLTLKEVVDAVDGIVVNQKETEFFGVGTDTRVDLREQIFIALRGDRFDAHRFLSQAVEKNAACLIIDNTDGIEAFRDFVTIVLVEDTLLALQQLANYWRHACDWKVVGITGTNGKTTTKEFAATILSKHFKVGFNKGSFNNHWGVPMSLLSVSKSCDVAIVEMGMNHLGELTRLSQIAEPDIVVCTNVGRGHVGEVGGVENVAKAKEEIYSQNKNAIKIFNIENEYTRKMWEKYKNASPESKTLTFASHVEEADIKMRVEEMTLTDISILGRIKSTEGSVRVPVFGRHNVANVMAASAIACTLGMSEDEIWQSISDCHTIWGRNQVLTVKNKVTLLFDGYNANPESVSALAKNFYEVEPTGRKVLILGEMGELGDESSEIHQEMGELVGKMDFQKIWFIGESFQDFEAGLKKSNFKGEINLSQDVEPLIAKRLLNGFKSGDMVAIKGSRFMKMERIPQTWGLSMDKV